MPSVSQKMEADDELVVCVECGRKMARRDAGYIEREPYCESCTLAIELAPCPTLEEDKLLVDAWLDDAADCTDPHDAAVWAAWRRIKEDLG